jgi:hypothetical protein
MTQKIRTFSTGATRNLSENKPDYEAYISPLVIERFGEYMLRNQKQADGSMRPGDNWQKGIDFDSYMKSAWRHFLSWWKAHRDYKEQEDIEDSLCAMIFNASGYLHETLKKKNG